MALVSTNMGLTRWNDPNDLFSYTQLAENFRLLDEHDHSTGKGVQIGTTGLANLAVTNAKIATDAVDATKIAAAAVGSSELIDGAVTIAKLVGGVVSYVGAVAGTTSSPTMASSTPALIPEMTITATFRAGLAIIVFNGQFAQATAGANVETTLLLDGSPAGTGGSDPARSVVVALAGGTCQITNVALVPVTAGSHTIVANWSVSSGTATATGTRRALVALQT
jgi:hypothetical protein